MTPSLVPLSSLPNGTIWALTDGLLTPAAGATAFVYEHGTTTQVTIYAETGETTLTQPLTSGATGQLPGYVLAEQDLDIVATFEGKTPPAAEVVPLRAADIVGVDSHTKALALGAGLVPLLSGLGGGPATDAEVAAAIKIETERAEGAESTLASGITSAIVTAEAASDTAGTAAADVKVEKERAEGAEALKIPLTQRAAANGVGTLDSEGHQPLAQVPPSVANSSAIYNENVWNWGPEGSRVYKLLAGGTASLRDGSGTLLSAVYATLAEAQVVYPFVTSLTASVDWAAIQKASNEVKGYGAVVSPPSQHAYQVNRPFIPRYGTSFYDLALGWGLESDENTVATLELMAGANCHLIEGDSTAPAGPIAESYLQSSRFRVCLDGNRFNQTAPVDAFHLNGSSYCTFEDGCFVRNVSGVGYYMRNTESCTGKISGRKCGEHVYKFVNQSDCIFWMNGYGSMQGSVFLHEASGGTANQYYGKLGNCNPPHGKLKATVTVGQTAGIVVVNEAERGDSATHLPTWGGTILIGTEQITYTKSTKAGKEFTLEGVTRGANSTAEAEHLTGALWNEYAPYQDGATVLGSSGRSSKFDLEVDENWHHGLNVPSGNVYGCIFLITTRQCAFENPEVQDHVVLNAPGCILIGTAIYLDQVEAHAPTANTAIGETVITLAGSEALGFTNGHRVYIKTLTTGVTGGLSLATFYVVGAKENGFELSETEGGAAIKVAGHALEAASTSFMLSSERACVQVGAEAKGSLIAVTGAGAQKAPYPTVINPDGTAYNGSENAENVVFELTYKHLIAFNMLLGKNTDGLLGLDLDTAVTARLEYEPTKGQMQVFNQALAIATAGKGLRVKEGENCKQGVTGGMTAGKITVANTSITATSRIHVTRIGGNTHPGAPFVATQTVGEGFVVESTNKEDTGAISYEIFEQG